MRSITVPGPGAPGGRQAYLAVPVRTAARPGPWPGVVVIHEALGPTDDMHEQCDWFAAAGYLALMPDLYHGKPMIRCVRGAVRQLAAQRGPMFEQIEAARTHLAARDDCTGAVGVAGYCLGGGFALLLAGRGGYDAAAVNYGELPKNLDQVLAGSCPIVASYGGRDGLVCGPAAATLTAALDRAGVPHDVKLYPPARHAFISRNVVPSPLTTLGKVVGVGYDHASAADAKGRILAFFDEHLRGPATG
jgi:carboxymethylenebutenolidase